MANTTNFMMHPYCRQWNMTFDALFQFGNVFLGSAYVIPPIFKLSLLAQRGFITLGLVMTILWSLYSICGLDMFLYNTSFFLPNCIYFTHLESNPEFRTDLQIYEEISFFQVIKHFPTFIPSEQRELYRKLFEPIKFSRKNFHLLMKEATINRLRAGRSFAIENETPIGAKLRILLSGKMVVTCDEIFLHFVMPMEFIDSIEWRAREQKSPDNNFQVSINAVYDCKFLEIPIQHLEEVFAEVPGIKFVIKCLVGKDITRKLYQMNENVYNASSIQKRRISASANKSMTVDLQRTNSTDAIHTGCRGYVRSKTWIEAAGRKHSSDGEQLMVLNFELDIPPSLTYLPHNVAVHTVDRSTMAEAQFIAQQRKYWPAGVF